LESSNRSFEIESEVMADPVKKTAPGLTFPMLLTMFWTTLSVGFYYAGSPPEPSDQHYTISLVLYRSLGCLSWISIAWLLARLFDVVLWRRAVLKRTGIEAPRLLVDLVRILILVGVFLSIVGFVFGQSINGVLLSSGVVGVVLGFALQNMISDFFSGIAISLEGPFRRGEWIKVDDVIGEVVEINWRSTRLLTLDDTMVVVPNSLLAQKIVINHEQPLGFFRATVPIALEYGVSVPEAKRVLLAGVRAAAGVMSDPEPTVVVTSFGADGIEYDMRFYVETYRSFSIVQDKVISAVNDALYRAGLGVPYPKRDVYYTQMPPRELAPAERKSTLLGRNELFESLEPDEIQTLAKGLIERRLTEGEDVVLAGADGDSLYLIVDGVLDVVIEVDGAERKVAQLRPGGYFGEMSLLAGEPRSATVRSDSDGTVYELSKQVLEPVLRDRPKIAETLSQIVARRQMELKKVSDQAADSSGNRAEQSSMASRLLGKIRGFFGLGS
jgi:small-conductance mechanosensitive channel/CRP-like cAMP-binding protein